MKEKCFHACVCEFGPDCYEGCDHYVALSSLQSTALLDSIRDAVPDMQRQRQKPTQRTPKGRLPMNDADETADIRDAIIRDKVF